MCVNKKGQERIGGKAGIESGRQLHRKRNMTEMYIITKKLVGKYTQSNKTIIDKNGQIQTTLKEQLERWVEH